MIWLVAATGQSLKADDVEYARGKARLCVVSDAFRLFPWAEVMVSHDAAWWKANKDALDFEGSKYCRNSDAIRGVVRYSPPKTESGINSGLYALHVLLNKHEASKILLLGFDMWGTHYFGKHKHPLKNTDNFRFRRHIKQFDAFKGCEVINCTPNSMLKRFPMHNIRDIL